MKWAEKVTMGYLKALILLIKTLLKCMKDVGKIKSNFCWINQLSLSSAFINFMFLVKFMELFCAFFKGYQLKFISFMKWLAWKILLQNFWNNKYYNKKKSKQNLLCSALKHYFALMLVVLWVDKEYLSTCLYVSWGPICLFSSNLILPKK